MKSLKIYISTLLLLVGMSTYPMDNKQNSLTDRMLNYTSRLTSQLLERTIGQSMAVCATQRKLAGFEHAIRDNLFNDTSIPSCADQQHQNMWQEAQDTVGVPTERQVPLTQAPQAKLEPSASVQLDSVSLNTRSFFELPYGVRRTALYCLAASVKNNDRTLSTIIPATAFATSAIGTKICFRTAKAIAARFMPSFSKFPKKYSWPLYGLYSAGSSLMSLKVGLLCARTSYDTCVRFGEHRAGAEGCYATGCYRCVDSCNNESNILSKMNTTELQQIADKLRTENKMCEYHKNTPDQVLLKEPRDPINIDFQHKDLSRIFSH